MPLAISRSAHIAPDGTRYLRTQKAAEYVGLASSTLAKMRISGVGPKFIKAGARIVLYDVADLDLWLVTQKRATTSEPGNG